MRGFAVVPRLAMCPLLHLTLVGRFGLIAG